jgi:hypothetical protein
MNNSISLGLTALLAVIFIAPFSQSYGTPLPNTKVLNLELPEKEPDSTIFVDPNDSPPSARRYINELIHQIKKTAFSHWPSDENGAPIYGSGDLIVTLRKDGVVEDVQSVPTSMALSESLEKLLKKEEPYSQFPADALSNYDTITFKVPYDFSKKDGDKFKAPFKVKGNNQHLGVQSSVPF